MYSDFLSVINFEALLLLNGSRWRHSICDGNDVHEKSF